MASAETGCNPNGGKWPDAYRCPGAPPRHPALILAVEKTGHFVFHPCDVFRGKPLEKLHRLTGHSTGDEADILRGLVRQRGDDAAFEQVLFGIDHVPCGQIFQTGQIDFCVGLALENIGLAEFDQRVALGGGGFRDCGDGGFLCCVAHSSFLLSGELAGFRQHIHIVDLENAVELVQLQALLPVHLDHDVGQFEGDGAVHALTLLHRADGDFLAPAPNHHTHPHFVCVLGGLDRVLDAAPEHKLHGAGGIDSGEVILADAPEGDFQFHAAVMTDHDGLVLTEDSVSGGGGRSGFKVRDRHFPGGTAQPVAGQVKVKVPNYFGDSCDCHFSSTS